MTAAPEPRLGAVYDVGAALAIYWPDTHPCGPNRAEPWLILLPDGGTQWAAELRDGARLLDYLPGFAPKRRRSSGALIADTLASPSPVSQAAVGPVNVFQPPPDPGYAAGLNAGYAAGYRHAKEGR